MRARIGLLRLLDVREVAGVVDFDQLRIGDIVRGLTAELRPISERLDGFGRGVTAKKTLRSFCPTVSTTGMFRRLVAYRLVEDHVVGQRGYSALSTARAHVVL